MVTTCLRVTAPSAAEGFRIAHISDFHNADLAEETLSALRGLAPDVIAVTGDLIDKRRPGMEHALALMRGAADLAPVFFCTGNHEAVSPQFPELAARLGEMGVRTLRDERVPLPNGLLLIGLDDPKFRRPGVGTKEALPLVEETLKRLLDGAEGYTVLLSHHPEYLPAYRAAGVRLVLAGHAHGGQWRLPMGVYAPGQGLFPRYTAGLYRRGETALAVSRGIGNSACPLRLFDPPEVVGVILSQRGKEGRISCTK